MFYHYGRAMAILELQMIKRGLLGISVSEWVSLTRHRHSTSFRRRTYQNVILVLVTLMMQLNSFLLH